VRDLGESTEFSSLEEEVFKALDHQIRRDILRYIGEGMKPSFTDIMNATRSPDSPTLSYHLKTLAPFLEQKNGRYDLNPIGKAAYTLLLRTLAYNKVALLHKKKLEAICGHIILWVSAIAAGLVLEVDSSMTTIILPSLAAASLITINKLFE
jgi:DNA-binding transcriptional ArsR family regulator